MRKLKKTDKPVLIYSIGNRRTGKLKKEQSQIDRTLH